MLDKILVEGGTSKKAKRGEIWYEEDRNDENVKGGWMKFGVVNALEKVEKLGTAIKLGKGEGKCLLGLGKCIVGEDEFSFSLPDNNVGKNSKMHINLDGEPVVQGKVADRDLWKEGWYEVKTDKIGNKRGMLRLVLRRIFYNITGKKGFAISLAKFVTEKFVDSEGSLEK